MTLEPLETSMTVGRVAIAASALSHSLFATFIVGSSLIGAITATCSYVTGKEWFSRLAKLIAFTLVLSTATISFLGVLLVFFLNMYWPQFWHRIFHVMFWPFIGEAALFLGEAILPMPGITYGNGDNMDGDKRCIWRLFGSRRDVRWPPCF